MYSRRIVFRISMRTRKMGIWNTTKEFQISTNISITKKNYEKSKSIRFNTIHLGRTVVGILKKESSFYRNKICFKIASITLYKYFLSSRYTRRVNRIN